LYTATEEREFDHIAGLWYYTEQVTNSIVHAVCKNAKGCDLNPLSGTPSYSLTKLERRHRIVLLLHNGNWLYWTICLVKRALSECSKSTVPSDSKLLAKMLKSQG
jgi:hypothetical protein